MKKISFYILLGTIMIASSCKKGFLDRYPQTEISPELFFKSENDLSLYINGLMNQAGTSSFLSDQNSDNMATTASIEVKNVMTGTPSSKTLTSGWSWTSLRDINYFLVNYNKASVAQDVKDHYAGLARYYRAIYYMGMVKRYSDVPWYSSTINPTDSAQLYKATTPRAAVMDSVMADLDFASKHVRENVPTGTPGVWAVKAFYARAALFEGTYRKYHAELNLATSANAFLQKAKDVSLDVITSGKFQIYNTGNSDKDYGTLFASADLSANKEVILNTPYDASKTGASSSNNNGTVFGDYEQSPSRDLIQTYLMKDGTAFTGIKGYETLGFVDEFQNRDPRMNQTIAYPGFKRATDTKPYVQRLNKNFTGYHQVKGYYSTTTDNIVLGSFDYATYRYAEVLLTYAEAAAELGTIAQSDLDLSVNLVRRRAGIPDLNLATANANPDAILAAKYPDVSGAQKGVTLEIRRERRVELAMEGFRYDDLMRWHAGKLLEKIPEGMYFPGLGKYDLTGDGIEDIILIGKDTDIPSEANKEKNALGDVLVYYKAGSFGENVTVYLRNGTAGGTLVTETTARNFAEPKYYYRPIPYTQTVLNPNLVQIFGWQ
jgi:hypothetical protein